MKKLSIFSLITCAGFYVCLNIILSSSINSDQNYINSSSITDGKIHETHSFRSSVHLSSVTLNSHISNSELPSLAENVITKKDPLRTIFPWPEDPACAHFTIQLAERNTLPKWALTSFPGSGVTWTRQMIEGVSGFYTGSNHYMDPPPIITKGNISESGVTDDPFCGCTIIDKDHEATLIREGYDEYFDNLYKKGYSDMLREVYGNKGILLLRNPLDVVFTYRHWQLKGKVGNAEPRAFQGPEWDEVVDLVAYAWADHAIRWIDEVKQGAAIHYEYFFNEETAERQIKRLFKAMNFPIDVNRLQCALAHRNRTDYKRKNKLMVPLLPDHRRKLLKSMHAVQQKLRQKKWIELPVHLYDL